MTSTAKILAFPYRDRPTPTERLRELVAHLASEIGADVTAKMLFQEGYRLTRDSAPAGNGI